MIQAPTYADVADAAHRLAGHAHRAPVLRSATADALTGAQVFFKCENFQRMGAFKFRGAYNALAKFTGEQRKAGVVTFSSGNHAQAIALSARMLGIPAAILMPKMTRLRYASGTRHDAMGSARTSPAMRPTNSRPILNSEFLIS